MHGDVLLITPTYEEYAEKAKQYYNADPPSVLPGPIGDLQPKVIKSADELRQAYNQLVLYQQQQMQNLRNNPNADYTFLKEVVPKLSDLQHVLVSLYDKSGPLPSRDPLGPFPRRSPFDPRVGLPWRISPSRGVRQVDSMMLALAFSPAREKLRRLQLGPFDWSFINQLNKSTPELDQIVDICRNLTTFDMTVRIGGTTGVDDTMYDQILIKDEILACRESFSQGSLRKILVSMPHLREMAMRFANPIPVETLFDILTVPSNQMTFSAAMLDILPNSYRWANLQNIILRSMDCTSKQLLDFLERHAPTLKSVRFQNIRLIDASWLDFLPRMRELIARVVRDSPHTPGLLHNILFTGILYGKGKNAYRHHPECWGTDEMDPEMVVWQQEGLSLKIRSYINSESDVLPLGYSTNFGRFGVHSDV